MYKCEAIKVAFVTIKENYLDIDRLGATDFGKLGHVFKPSVSIHIPRLCVMDCTVQWNFKLDIFGVLLGLVHNDGWHE